MILFFRGGGSTYINLQLGDRQVAKDGIRLDRHGFPFTAPGAKELVNMRQIQSLTSGGTAGGNRPFRRPACICNKV